MVLPRPSYQATTMGDESGLADRTNEHTKKYADANKAVAGKLAAEFAGSGKVGLREGGRWDCGKREGGMIV